MKEERGVCVLEGGVIPSWPPVERQLDGWLDPDTLHNHTCNEKSTDRVAQEPQPPVFTEIIKT